MKTINVIKNIKLTDEILYQSELCFAIISKNDLARFCYCQVIGINGNEVTCTVINGGWCFAFDKITGKISSSDDVSINLLTNLKLIWIGKSNWANYNKSIIDIINDVKNGISINFAKIEVHKDENEIPF